MSPRAAVAGVAFFAYLALAFSVHDLYPFSTFAMFAGGAAPRASRLLARKSDGTTLAVETFVAWRCDGPVRLEHDACGGAPYSQIDYRDRAAAAWVESHTADGRAPAEPIAIVRRIWQLDAGAGPPPFVDCVLTRCQATPQ
jgi:hypothetical protein